MRLVLVKTVRLKDNSKATMIYKLIKDGKLKGYANQNGELMYDRDEYSNYRKVNHRGRPRKIETTKVDTRRRRNAEATD